MPLVPRPPTAAKLPEGPKAKAKAKAKPEAKPAPKSKPEPNHKTISPRFVQVVKGIAAADLPHIEEGSLQQEDIDTTGTEDTSKRRSNP